jgi:hypothetical protein
MTIGNNSKSVSGAEEVMVRRNRRAVSTNESFPYYSYLKHKKQLPILDPYIVSNETKIYNSKYKVNNTLTLRNTTKVKEIHRENNESSFRGEGDIRIQQREY